MLRISGNSPVRPVAASTSHFAVPEQKPTLFSGAKDDFAPNSHRNSNPKRPLWKKLLTATLMAIPASQAVAGTAFADASPPPQTTQVDDPFTDGPDGKEPKTENTAAPASPTTEPTSSATPSPSPSTKASKQPGQPVPTTSATGSPATPTPDRTTANPDGGKSNGKSGDGQPGSTATPIPVSTANPKNPGDGKVDSSPSPTPTPTPTHTSGKDGNPGNGDKSPPASTPAASPTPTSTGGSHPPGNGSDPDDPFADLMPIDIFGPDATDAPTSSSSPIPVSSPTSTGNPVSTPSPTTTTSPPAASPSPTSAPPSGKANPSTQPSTGNGLSPIDDPFGPSDGKGDGGQPPIPQTSASPVSSPSGSTSTGQPSNPVTRNPKTNAPSPSPSTKPTSTSSPRPSTSASSSPGTGDGKTGTGTQNPVSADSKKGPAAGKAPTSDQTHAKKLYRLKPGDSAWKLAKMLKPNATIAERAHMVDRIFAASQANGVNAGYHNDRDLAIGTKLYVPDDILKTLPQSSIQLLEDG